MVVGQLLYSCECRMRHYFPSLLLAMAMPAAGAVKAQEQCGFEPMERAHLHWSEPAAFRSVLGRWGLKVGHDQGLGDDDDRAYVQLVGCRTGREFFLFHLTRFADVWWSPSGNQILVIDEPGNLRARILLFSADEIARGQRPDHSMLDKLIRMHVERERQGGEIVFFVPKLVSWRAGHLELLISVRSAKTAAGPQDGHCYRVEVTGSRYQKISAFMERQCGKEEGV